MLPTPGPGVIACGGNPRALEGEMTAWRNLLWDSVRMLHAGRPDLAKRFRTAAAEVEQRLKSLQQVQRQHTQPQNGIGAPQG